MAPLLVQIRLTGAYVEELLKGIVRREKRRQNEITNLNHSRLVRQMASAGIGFCLRIPWLTMMPATPR